MANTKKFVAKNGLQADNIRLLSPDETSEISLVMLDGGTLSFNGSNGQLFSVTDDMTGTIFSVNDVSGVPSIEVDDDGTIRFAELSGNVLIGTTVDNGTDRLQVAGGLYAQSLSGDGSAVTNVDAATLGGSDSAYHLDWTNTTNKPTTDGIPEGTSNYYFTTPRTRAAFSASGDLSYNASTGVISFSETYSTASEIKTAYESNANTNAYTDSDKSKLAGIASGSEVNAVDSVNGQTGAVSLDSGDITEGTNLYFTNARARSAISVSGDLSYSAGVISFNETYSTASQIKTAYESNTNTNAYTDSEKSKLAGIEAGAQVNVGTNLGVSRNSTSYTITSSTGSNTTLSAATAANAGVMLATDKSKLDGIESGAQVNDVTTVAGQTGAVTLDTDDVSEGTNQYFTSARATTAIKNDIDWKATNWNTAYGWGNHANAGYALDSAISTVGKTGSYNDLTDKPDLSAFDELASYASASSFPTTGETDKLYVAEDIGGLFRWNGTGYTQLTGQTAIWGQISGTLSNQTDLQNALNGKAASSHSHTAGDLPANIMYEGENISLLNNNAGYITSAPVDSVNGQTGAVVLDSDDVSEGTGNLYFTNARARGAISVSGDLSYAGGVVSFSETYSTPSELLTAIKTVDGSTSGLDADLLDGQHGSYYLDWNNATNKPSFDNYGGWTLNTDGTSRGNIASSETVRFNGGSNTSLSYSSTNNAITINSTDTTYGAGTGITLSGTTFSLTDEAYTSAEKTKLSGIAAGAEVNTVDSVAGKTGAVSLVKADVGLGSVRNVSSYSQSEADSNFVDVTGDAMTGSLKINTADDGVNDLQVGGSSSLTGDVGVGTSSPEEKLDVAGNARIRNENSMKFGGTGAADAQFAIQYNAATKSLDFNWIGG